LAAEILDLHRMPALGVHQRGLPVDVARAPRRERAHDDPQLAPLVGQGVLRAGRMVGVEPACDERVLLHKLEAVREDVGRDPREAPLEILKPSGPGQHVPDEQKGPAVADQLERLRDRTGLTVTLGHTPSLSHVLTEKLVTIE